MERSTETPRRAHDTYYPAFDYLRIVLAAVVMLYHDHVIEWRPAGDLAVRVFFALSGWLIGGILLRQEREQLPRFYFNRSLRIWVPYYVALLLLVAASVLRDPLGARWAEFVFYKGTFVYNLFGMPQGALHAAEMPLAGTGHHFWSVNAEEQFYLLAPLVLVLGHKRWRHSIGLWTVIAAVAWATDVYASIVFGVLAAVIVRHHGDVHLRPVVRAVLALVVVSISVAVIAGADYLYLSPFFSVALVLLLATKGKQQRLGEWLGGMSYPLYLNHWVGVFVANMAFTPLGMRHSVVRTLSAVLLNFAIAGAHYAWIDRRLLAQRSALYTPGRARGVITLAYLMVVVGVIGGLLITHGRS